MLIICGSGGRPDYYADPRDEIFRWSGDDWVEVGKMRVARYHHAVSIIQLDEDLCVSSWANRYVAIHWLLVTIVRILWKICGNSSY